MTQYIDKAAVVAEIERRKHKLLDNIIFEHDKEWVVRTAHQLNRIIWFLDTLEVKEMDLEKEYDNEFFKDPVFGKLVNRNAGISIAKHFFELGLKTQKGE